MKSLSNKSIKELQKGCVTCGHFFHAHTIFMYPWECMICHCKSFQEKELEKK